MCLSSALGESATSGVRFINLRILAAAVIPFWKFGVNASAFAMVDVPMMSDWETLLAKKEVKCRHRPEVYAILLENVSIWYTVVPDENSTIVHTGRKSEIHETSGQTKDGTSNVLIQQGFLVMRQQINHVQLVEGFFTTQRHHCPYIAHCFNCDLNGVYN